MKTHALLYLGLIACGAPRGHAAAGIYDAHVFTTAATGSTPSPLTFYQLTGFGGTDLGTFSTGDTLRLGGQQKSYKSGSTDVTAHDLFYRVYRQGTVAGSFVELDLNFQWNRGDAGAPGSLGNPGDQQWGNDIQGANHSFTGSTNLLNGLTAGTYVLEVYSRITTNGMDESTHQFVNNGGSNYTAGFTVVPEPGSALAGLLLGAALIRRRR